MRGVRSCWIWLVMMRKVLEAGVGKGRGRREEGKRLGIGGFCLLGRKDVHVMIAKVMILGSGP